MALDFESFYASDPAKAILLFSMLGTRIIVALGMLPPLSKELIPRAVVGGLGLALVLPVALGSARSNALLPVEMEFVPLVIYFCREGAIGFVLGWGFGAFFASLQSIGHFIDHQTGLTFTQNIDGQHGNSTSTTAQFLERLLFPLLISAGALLSVIDVIYLSYSVWPPGQSIPKLDKFLPLLLIDQSGKLFSLSLLMAGPVLLLLFIVDACMATLNRAAPALNLYNITLSIKPLVGLFVLIMALPMVVHQSIEALQHVSATAKLFLNRE